MSQINFCILQMQGRLVADPEMSTTNSGLDVCKFRVAANRRFGGKEKTSFVSVTVFGKDAENCYNYLSKGRVVFVEGDFETDEWVDKEGNKRNGFGVIANRVEFGPGGTKVNGEDEEEDTATTHTVKSAYNKASAYLKKNK